VSEITPNTGVPIEGEILANFSEKEMKGIKKGESDLRCVGQVVYLTLFGDKTLVHCCAYPELQSGESTDNSGMEMDCKENYLILATGSTSAILICEETETPEETLERLAARCTRRRSAAKRF